VVLKIILRNNSFAVYNIEFTLKMFFLTKKKIKYIKIEIVILISLTPIYFFNFENLKTI